MCFYQKLVDIHDKLDFVVEITKFLSEIQN